jgi:undecaprenyl-diphosphatase
MKSKSVIAGLVILALVAGFAALASNVLEEDTTALDHALLNALRADVSDPLGPPWLERAVLNLSALGSVAVTALIVSVATVFLLLARKPRQAALVVGVASVAAIGLTLLKNAFGRARPTLVDPIEVVAGLSFPSGHTVIAAVLYPTLGMLVASNLRARHLKVFVFVVAALLALVVGFSRVYLGVHYPSDVLGGWLLGLAVAIAAGLVIQMLKKQHVIERPAGETVGDEVGPIP